MHATRALLIYTARLTLFTKANCGLCDVAKAAVAEVRQRRSVDYGEVDIMAASQQAWHDLYAFDVPVLHVERVHHTYAKPDVVAEVRKLMHRFSPDEVEALVDEAEGAGEASGAGRG